MIASPKLRWADMRVGDRLGPVHYVLTPAIAAEFIEAANVGSAAEAMLMTADGQPAAHPLLTQSDYLQLLQDRYGPMGTGLHTSQETVIRASVPLQTRLTGSGEVVDLFSKRGRDYWTIAYSVSADGRVLVEHRMTASVDRENQEAPVTNIARPSSEPAGRGTAPAAGPFEVTTPSLERAFTSAMPVAFDRQYWLRFGENRRTTPNAHNDADYARAAGLPDVIAHSSHYYAWFAELALMQLGRRWLTGGTLKARFLGPVFPGDVLSVAIEAGTDDEISLEATNQHDRVISTGAASVPARPSPAASGRTAQAR